MRLATLRTDSGTAAVRVDADALVEISGTADVRHVAAESRLERPGKIICVGRNSVNHILEMGRELPQFPTLFAKYREALITNPSHGSP